MSEFDLEAIRARDAACAVPKAPIEAVQWAQSNADRRALLAEVDRLRFEWQVQISKVIGLELTVDELRSEINRLRDWQRRAVQDLILWAREHPNGRCTPTTSALIEEAGRE